MNESLMKMSINRKLARARAILLNANVRSGSRITIVVGDLRALRSTAGAFPVAEVSPRVYTCNYRVTASQR